MALKPEWSSSALYLCPTHRCLSQVTTSFASHPFPRHLPWPHLIPMSSNQVPYCTHRSPLWLWQLLQTPSQFPGSHLHCFIFCLLASSAAGNERDLTHPWPAGRQRSPCPCWSAQLFPPTEGTFGFISLEMLQRHGISIREINKGYQDLTFKQVNEV